MSEVSFVKIRENEYKDAITEALNLISYDFNKQIKNVVIKANMCYYWEASTGQTSDPKFVGALIDVLRERLGPDVKILVVESDASAMKCKYAFSYLGFDKMSQDYGVKLVNLSEVPGKETQIAVNGQSFTFTVPDIISNADLKINVTKIKYSWNTIKITCALKNIFGCNPYPKKYKLHSQLNEAIVAVNKAMPFNLCLIDANIVYGAETRKLGLVMASKDSVAIDAAAAKIASVNPNKMPFLKMAEAEGLGKMSFAAKGEPLEYYRAKFPKKNLTRKLMGQALKLVIFFRLNKRLGLE